RHGTRRIVGGVVYAHQHGCRAKPSEGGCSMSHMTPERQQIQEAARTFAREVVRPLADRLDPLRQDIPLSLREQLGEMGYFGILVPEEYGGLGLGCTEYCLITEQLSGAWMSVSSIIRNIGLMVAP